MRKWVKTLAALSGHSAVQRTRQRQLQRVRKQVAPLCKVRHGRLQPQCQLSRHLDEGKGGAWADGRTGGRLVRQPGKRCVENSGCQQGWDPAADGSRKGAAEQHSDGRASQAVFGLPPQSRRLSLSSPALMGASPPRGLCPAGSTPGPAGGRGGTSHAAPAARDTAPAIGGWRVRQTRMRSRGKGL